MRIININVFHFRNVAKQGGVLSPKLFSVYINNLLIELQNNEFGCHVGNTFMGCFGYADDVTLLLPTVTRME